VNYTNKNPHRITIYFDGACRNIKNESSYIGIGVAIKVNRIYREDLSKSLFVIPDGDIRGTSNVAEWCACVTAMRLAINLKKQFSEHKLYVFSDSQVITKQFNGNMRIKEETFIPFRNTAQLYAKEAGINEIVWVRRKWNTDADKLSKDGLKEALYYDERTITTSTLLQGKEWDFYLSNGDRGFH
jgi:ribonuclease HI